MLLFASLVALWLEKLKLCWFLLVLAQQYSWSLRNVSSLLLVDYMTVQYNSKWAVHTMQYSRHHVVYFYFCTTTQGQINVYPLWYILSYTTILYFSLFLVGGAGFCTCSLAAHWLGLGPAGCLWMCQASKD